MAILISLYIWSFLVITLLPLFVVYSAVWILVWPFDRYKTVTHYFTALWAQLYLTINPGWTLAIVPIILQGASDALPKKGLLFKVRQRFTIRVLDEISADTVTRMELSPLIAHTWTLMDDCIRHIKPRLQE